MKKDRENLLRNSKSFDYPENSSRNSAILQLMIKIIISTWKEKSNRALFPGSGE